MKNFLKDIAWIGGFSSLLFIFFLGAYSLSPRKANNYNITHPLEGKHSAIINIEKSNGGGCTAFVISDTVAITAGHCVGISKIDIININKKIKTAEKTKKMLDKYIAKLRVCPTLKCRMMLIKSIPEYNKFVKLLNNLKTLKPDEYKVLNTYGEDTKIVAIADIKNVKDRDHAVLTGDFKNFEKIKVQKDFTLKKGDLLRSCGYASGHNPPICTDFVAISTSVFKYIGTGYFVRGMSGGPLINEDGVAVGVISAMSGNVAIIDTLIGVFAFEYTRPEKKKGFMYGVMRQFNLVE